MAGNLLRRPHASHDHDVGQQLLSVSFSEVDKRDTLLPNPLLDGREAQTCRLAEKLGTVLRGKCYVSYTCQGSAVDKLPGVDTIIT